MIISKHISYNEAVYSNTAKRKQIDNKPSAEQVDAMKTIALNIFEPLRNLALPMI